jgi:hypothetical protein
MATGFQSEIKAAFDEVDSAARATPTTSRAKPVAPPPADGPGADVVEGAEVDQATVDAPVEAPVDVPADGTPADGTRADEAPGRDDAVA